MIIWYIWLFNLLTFEWLVINPLCSYGTGQRTPNSPQQMYEAPACVQNAMMNKDKKPFTYTPGGIDLSQIKSERMARRLARNAQAEGVGGGAKSAPIISSPQSPGSAANSMAASSLGMPFQVLPPNNAVPPSSPSMAAGKSLNGVPPLAPVPPPPPPSYLATINPTTNQSHGVHRFEPPPMGFRPEIKIPPNPMAALRKITPPVEKNSFWKDEYVKDRSKSPMVEQQSLQSVHNDHATTSGSSMDTADGENTEPNKLFRLSLLNSKKKLLLKN